MLKIELTPKIAELNPTLTLDDVERIGELDRLARIISDKDNHDVEDICLPRQCGEAFLQSPTVGGAIWYEDRVLNWFANDPLTCDLCLAYILAGGEYRLFCNPSETKRAVRDWAKRSLKGVKPAALRKTIEQILPREKSLGNDEDSDYGPVLEMLVDKYGKDLDYWLHKCPSSVIKILVSQTVKKNMQEMEAAKKASGVAMPPIVTEKTLALIEYKKEFEELVASWQK